MNYLYRQIGGIGAKNMRKFSLVSKFIVLCSAKKLVGLCTCRLAIIGFLVLQIKYPVLISEGIRRLCGERIFQG